MILDVIVANIHVTDNNDCYTAECLQDVANQINKNPRKLKLYESLSGTTQLGKAVKAEFDGKRLHVFFEFERPYITLAGNLPGKQGLPKLDIFETLFINKLEDVRFGLTTKPSFKDPNPFKVSGSVCAKCYSIDVTEDDEFVDDDDEETGE